MKDAFQHQEDGEEDEMIIGPNGKAVLSPEAIKKKQAKDRAKSEEVSV